MLSLQTIQGAVLACLLMTAPAPLMAAEDGTKVGVDGEVTYASAYMFRGYNVFQKGSQMDQHGMLAPGLTWTARSIPLTIGYWGAFQVNGKNLFAMVDAGLGAEQDLFISYDISLPHNMGLSVGAYWYFYPLARPAIAGTNLPSYLEPTVAWSWSGVVDVGLGLAFFAGLQDALSDYRYLYINPSVSRSFALSTWASLGVGASFGYKVFTDPDKMTDNVYDVFLGVDCTFPMGKLLTIKPGVAAAWTNLAGRDFADEVGVFGTLTLGAAL